jgi:surface protein
MNARGRREAVRSSLVALLLVVLALAGCSGAPGNSPANSSVVGVRIDDGPRTLAVGSTLALSATVTTTGGADTAVAWSSSDEGVAMVDADGVVRGIAPGEADITASSEFDPAAFDTVTITVLSPMLLVADTRASGRRTVRLPLHGLVDVTIDWGDGQRSVVNEAGEVSHAYLSDSIYTIAITGNLTEFGGGWFRPGALGVTSVLAWGELGLTSLSGAFSGVEHLRGVPGDLPSSVTDLSYMFNDAWAFDDDIGGWNVSNVTSMRAMFAGAESFAADIGGWDVSNVTDMSGMFAFTLVFDADIGGWDVGSVTDMSGMFDYSVFDRDIGGWDVGNVTDMSGMFAASLFDRDIGSWDVGNVTDMRYMFADAMRFDRAIGGWDVSSVTDMRYMFGSAFDYGVAFDQDIGGWDVSSVTTMQGMFEGAVRFDQDIGAWDVGNVTDMSRMFLEAESFDQDIGGWDVGNVADMTRMFTRAHSFDQDLSNWCVARIAVEPDGFDAAAHAWSSPRPRWGTCPDR